VTTTDANVHRVTPIQLGLRTYVRYVVPLTLLAVIALLPIAATGALAKPPADADAARGVVRLVWLCAATAWIGQLWLVGGAAVATRAMATSTPLSQLRAFTRGFIGMVRAIVPVGAAIAAIVAGSLALVLPGLALLGLFALAGASEEPSVPARLADSAAAVRAAAKLAIVTVAAIVAIDLVLVPITQAFVVAPLAKKPAPAELAAFRSLVRTVAVALVIVSPIAATMLAAIRIERGTDQVRR
jgi:hypothetical protein